MRLDNMIAALEALKAERRAQEGAPPNTDQPPEAAACNGGESGMASLLDSGQPSY